MALPVSKLKSQLLTSGLQQKDPVLYQLIREILNNLGDIVGGNSGTGSGGASSDADLLTWSDELADLPNSRELLAGDGISFDDSVFGDRTITNELSDETIITESDESAIMPNSRRLIAGTNITFNIGTPNQLEINNSAPFVEWSVLTNPATPELIFDSDGDVIMTHTP